MHQVSLYQALYAFIYDAVLEMIVYIQLGLQQLQWACLKQMSRSRGRKIMLTDNTSHNTVPTIVCTLYSVLSSFLKDNFFCYKLLNIVLTQYQDDFIKHIAKKFPGKKTDQNNSYLVSFLITDVISASN